jgi:hypothetical protein
MSPTTHLCIAQTIFASLTHASHGGEDANIVEPAKFDILSFDPGDEVQVWFAIGRHFGRKDAVTPRA